MMKRSYAWLWLAVTILACGSAYADGERRYDIMEGNLVIQPGFCIPEECSARDAGFYGTFTAIIDGDRIAFSDIQLRSEYSGFQLPADPYDLSGGSVSDIKFGVDGDRLTANGYIDSRAFDGPLIEYSFVAVAQEEVTGGFDADNYYLARLDYRRCAAPDCGGIYVRKLNNLRMTCPDGTQSRECYIGRLALDAIGLDPFAEGAKPGFNTNTVFKGQVQTGVEYHETRGVFVVEEVWGAVTGRRAVGRYYGILNNEIVCITTPCFSYDQYALNMGEMRAISDIDLTEVGASDQALSEAYQRMAEGEPLLVSGLNRREKGELADGVRFTATQFYLPVEPKRIECDEGYHAEDGQCVTRNGCVFPSIELETIGGIEKIDPRTGESRATITYSCEENCAEPATLTSNGYCQLALP